MKPSAFLLLALAALALPSPAAQTGHAVYRPGLTQARIPFPSDCGYKTAYEGTPILVSNLLVSVTNATWLDRTLDVFKDGGNTNGAPNPLSGQAWPWLIQSGHGIFAYEGEIWLEAGTNYSFYGRNYNGEALVIDGVTRVWQGPRDAWNYAPELFGAFTPAKSGWVDFNAWLWSFNGNTGPVGNKCAWGLQWNPNGIVPAHTETDDVFALAKDTSVWSRFVDPGDGTFLRTVTTNRFTTVGASEAVSGGRSFALSFEGVPTNATLVAFTGPYDGGHATSEWAAVSAALAQVPAGDSTATVTVPLAADAKVLRFRLATGSDIPADGVHPFEEWTEMLAVSASPVVRLDSAAPGYTNVVVAGSLGSFGLGGASAGVTLEIAAADDAAFASPVAATNLPSASVLGAFSVELFGLATNTAYLVRASAVNDQSASGVSATLPIRTAEPAPPVASLAVSVAAFQTATLAATVSDWGGGSWDAQAWIDVSEDADFPAGATQTLGPLALSGHLPAKASATATGLDPDSSYFARARIANSWGVETVSETVAFRTSADPIHFPEPTATAEKGHVSVSLAPTFVADGTTYSVELYAEGPGFSGTWRTWAVPDEEPPFEWGRSTRPGAFVSFRYTINWTYGDRTGRIVVETDTTAQLADRKIDALPKIDPAYEDAEYHGVYLRPGDTVEIVPSPGATIAWHTNAVLSVSKADNGSFVVEALEPGAALLYEPDDDTDPTNNVRGIAIVLPAEDPAGGIYVRRTLEAFTWTDPDAWEMVAEGPQGYPDAAGAWVYIATPSLPTSGHNLTIQITKPVTVGNLAVGQLGWIRHGYNTPKKDPWKSHWAWVFGDDEGLGGSITFDSGDGSESRLLMLGHAYNVSRVWFEVPVSMANDLAVDELWRVQDTAGWANTWYVGLYFWRPVDIGTNTFKTIRGLLYVYPPSQPWSNNTGNGLGAKGFVSFYNDIFGSGTIRLEADSMVGCVQSDAHDLSFAGTWDIANGQNESVYGGAGFTWPGTSLGRSREMIVRGSWLRADPYWPGGAFVRTGQETTAWNYSHDTEGAVSFTNDWRGIVPPRITLDGGCLYFHPNYLTGAGLTAYNANKIRKNVYDIGTLSIPAGPMGLLSIRKSSNDVKYPDQFTTITNLEMEAGAVLALNLSDSATNKTNEVYIVNEPDGWTDDFDPDRQFLPSLFANNEIITKSKYGNTMSGTAVDNTFLIFRDKTTGLVTRETPAPSGNGYRRWDTGETLVDGTSYISMQLASNVTNAFAEGATVRSLAGYLDMRKGAALGRPGEDAGATLAFGGQPARVYVGNWDEVGTIGCRLSGSAGLVKGGSGILALAASAEGVAGGVRVAGGTLALGVPGTGGTNFVGRVAGDVRVEAGSRLVVRDKASFAPGVRLFLNDRDWIPSYAHIRLESNASAAKLFVCGEAMPNGYYGSSEAALVHSDINVDDVHFEGPGVLWAGVRPTMMIFR